MLAESSGVIRGRRASGSMRNHVIQLKVTRGVLRCKRDLDRVHLDLSSVIFVAQAYVLILFERCNWSLMSSK